MKLFLILFLSLSAFAVEDEKTAALNATAKRKAEMGLFKQKVSSGDKCRVRDYKCFEEQLMTLALGGTEDLVGAHYVIAPFYKRSVKEGDIPCIGSCLQNMLAHHIDVFLKFILVAHNRGKDIIQTSDFPTIDGTRIRAIRDLGALGATLKNVEYLERLIAQLKPKDITDSDVKDTSRFSKELALIKQGKIFENSVLCHIGRGDLVYEEIMFGDNNDSSYRNLAKWLKTFESEMKKNICKSTQPLDYRGLDESTMLHYEKIRDQKIAAIDCKDNDFNCVRKKIREIGIHYAIDIPRISEFLNKFIEKSKPKKCDETCQSQYLVRTIQTWISYYGTFDRSKLASTIDWKANPEARFQTMEEDMSFYHGLKQIFEPLVTEFAKIDPRTVKDISIRSELKSVGKDLSDYSSGRWLKDSVICTMDPWVAAYDKYLSPFKNPIKDKKFEEVFLEFKSNICK